MELYEKDNFMKQFVPIIKEKAKYPLIVDNDDIICSLPPIINGEHSKVRFFIIVIFYVLSVSAY